jgi:signal peptidase I
MVLWSDRKKFNCNPEACGMSGIERRNAGNQAVSERRGSDVQGIADALRIRGRVYLHVQGSSMLPWVRPGDIALLGKVSPEEIRCGDILLFRRENRILVHRKVERFTWDRRTFFVTKGDANPHADGVIVPSEILGRLERIYRGGRRIEFDSRESRALNVLIARVSSRTRFWSALVHAHRVAIRPARRLLRTLRFSPAISR